MHYAVELKNRAEALLLLSTGLINYDEQTAAMEREFGFKVVDFDNEEQNNLKTELSIGILLTLGAQVKLWLDSRTPEAPSYFVATKDGFAASANAKTFAEAGNIVFKKFGEAFEEMLKTEEE